MDLEPSSRELAALLLSNRAIERKKSAESLKDLLTRNALPSLLTTNTIKKRGFSWNDLFDDINEYILKETEKVETSKTFENATRPLCSSLLHMCVAGANKGKAYLKCDKVLEACLFVLRNNRLSKVIGDTYLNLLNKHILPCEHYLGYISPTNWEDLLNVCTSMCLSSDLKLDNYTKLRLVLLIIRNGSKYCQFTNSLRDMLTKLKKCFIQLQNDNKVQEIVIEIIILLLEMLSTECRLVMCDFSENMTPLILKYYDHSLEQKKKIALFKLLELTVKLHHPGGKLRHEEGSLANNWEMWNKQLDNVLEVVTLEVAHLQKSRKTNECSEIYQISTLAAAVYYQCFHTSTNSHNESEVGSTSKRQKLHLNKYRTLSDLIYQLQLNHTPWLAIVRSYIKQYGHTVPTTDYISIIKILDILVNGSNPHMDWELVKDITWLIVSNLKFTTSYRNDLDDAFLLLWNSCVRNSTAVNAAYRHVHSIMQVLLKIRILKYYNVQPLIKLYLEKGMPVNNSSVMTLTVTLSQFLNKCSSQEQRARFLTWFSDDNNSVDDQNTRELIIRLVSNENINAAEVSDARDNEGNDRLFNILFQSIDKSILFSEFELEKETQSFVKPALLIVKSEVNVETDKLLRLYLENILTEYAKTAIVKCSDFILHSQSVRRGITYLDVMLKYQFLTSDAAKTLQTYKLLKKCITKMFECFVTILKTTASIPNKIELLNYMKELMIYDYEPLLNSELRCAVPEDFFHFVNNVITSDRDIDDSLEYDGDESEMNAITLKYNCVYTLAAYCRVAASYREELLELILDPKLYEFSSVWDVRCAYKCINILIESELEDIPLESIFVFMQHLCKDLFRMPDATLNLLNIFLKLLDRLWLLGNEMQINSFIMIRGYLDRCEKLFYPPTLAALIYKCATNVIAISNGDFNDVNHLMKCIIKKSRGDIHCLRIYCSYLLETLINIPSFKVETYLCDISDIFLINVSERDTILLKDESMNRTLSLLHSLVVLATGKKILLKQIVFLILKLQHEKSLDKKIVKKVLNIITSKVEDKTIEDYLNRHILSVLYFWFTEKFDLNELPLVFFGNLNRHEFLEKHMRWLISADILWRCGGNINDSIILKQSMSNLKLPASKIVEKCFCNIIVLCLPYIVSEKYKLNYVDCDGVNNFKRALINANRMYQLTRQILENEKWSNLFVENVGELLLLTAMHLCNSAEANEQFNVAIPAQVENYLYPKKVFLAITNYFGELTDGNIMQYLCENQPVAIFKILIRLWENMLQENVIELKVLAIHTFKSFFECIPLGLPSDAFVCNYVCNCFSFAIKKCKDNEELKILTKVLRSILVTLLPRHVGILRKALSQLLSTLIIKKDEGYETESAALLNYLVIDMKDYLKEEEDVVDFIKSMSTQCSVQNRNCSSLEEFSDKLKTFKSTLNCPSYEPLVSLKQFLKNNSEYLNIMCKNLDMVRFSEDCGRSTIHQIIHQLSNILKTVKDSKTVIEACNCLSVIGTYDLKTLITLPPPDTRVIVAMEPRNAVAVAVISSLSGAMFDENPAVTNKITKTLNRLLKFREAVVAIDSDQIEKQIIRPFTSDQIDEYATFIVDEVKFKTYYSDSNSMVPEANENHHHWLIKHTIALLDVLGSDANYFNCLKEVCLLKPTICEAILPSLVGLLIYNSSEKNIHMIAKQINQFFKYIWDTSFDDKVDNSANANNVVNGLDQNHKFIIQYLLEVVNFVRLQRNKYTRRPQNTSSRESLNYLNLDYDKVAWAATVADQNLSAIYYGELWAAAMNDNVPPSSPEATTLMRGGKDLQRILRKSYVSIAEMDAIDGCGTAHLTIEHEKRKHLINTGQYLDALIMHDIGLSCSCDDLEMQHGVVRSLHNSGMYHLALQYIKSLPENEQLNDVKYECLSSLGDWSEFVDTRDLEENNAETNRDTQSILKAFRYSCLKDCLNIQIKQEFEDKLVQPLNRAKMTISKLCQELNMENCQSVYKILSKLHLFTDIEEYFAVRFDKLPLSDLLFKWRVENLPAFQDFKHLDDLISQRNVILEHAAKTYSSYIKDVTSLQLQYAELSLKNDRIQMSQRLLAVLKKLQISDEVTLLESQISWAKGHKDIALSLLRNIVSRSDNPSSDLEQTAVSLRLYGLWMAESKSDNARDIINKYLKKSLEVLTRDDVKTRQKLYFDIAKFADAEYKQVVMYMNSSIFQNKVKCFENMKDTASTLRLTQQSLLSKDDRKVLLINERFKDIEETDIISTRNEKQSFLQLAMRYYLLSLKECEENNLSVFRVISLWLDNPDIEMVDDNKSFEDMLHAIPSRKFVAVLPQLAPRLTDESNPFADNLKKIIKRCALEHPHHTLPILFSLKNSDMDKYILNASQGANGNLSRSAIQEPRVVVADALVKGVAEESAVHAVIISQMEQLCNAIISFANYKPKGKEPKQKIPSAEIIQKLRHLDAIPIPTDTIPVQYDCNYSNLNTLLSFDNYFELVGGINCPKKINCVGSNGERNILLIKGEDDLRQDAVMQQVFNIVNTLLEKNSVTNKNKLIIRTYKVVPMSRRSGVLEWCVGTIPIGAYLVGTNAQPGAHARYRPKDISCSAAREILTKCNLQKKSNKEKLSKFIALLSQFKPVFHYFFTEHYLDPVTWYERRLAYTKSVATSSMVGYILGLGDRHLQNILIDKKTAEVIHIDFGIAFDQGKALPTPETIPFRLTQDIIAGFGCSGVEGIFRRSCEKTMQLLRDNQETLQTILEVLLCDPLYSWTLSPAQLAVPSGPNTSLCPNSSNSSLAERALLAVSSKLSGTEGGVAGGVAVPGQIARLINTATDPGNLCRVFPGWQPYL